MVNERARVVFGVPAAFRHQRALLEAQLELTRGRIRFALDHRERRANGEHGLPEWPPEFAAAERHIEERVAASIDAGAELPLAWLSTRLELGSDALRLIWVCLAHELDPVARGMLRQLNTETSADPTTDTLRIVAFGPYAHAAASRLLAPNSMLVRTGLIERADSDATASDHRKTWKVARRLVALAHGDESLDPELHRFATIPDDAEPIGIGGLGVEVDPAIIPKLTTAMQSNRGAAGTIVVQGPRGVGRRSLLRIAADSSCIDLLEVDLRHLSANPSQARAQLVALARECRLLRRIPLLRDLDMLVATEGTEERAVVSTERLALAMRELEGLLILATTSRVIPGNILHKPLIVEPAALNSVQRALLWSRALPSISDRDADLLATMYPIAPALIDAAASVARAQLTEGDALDPAHIRVGLRAVLDGQLAGVATRVETKQGWQSLVLPPEQHDSIDELIARVRRRRTVYETWGLGERVGRGLGVSAIFSGPPGTGKTMAAGLIARELATDLYQVDMSKVISKWIGETEKNLAHVFDAAEAGHAILLFDEADALFGRRTEVKSSNDRHANQETNYLLQRLEQFSGVCILTTNNDNAIDEAFRRRLSIHVHFPMPEFGERVELWRSMVIDSIPTDGKLDFPGLAKRYEMSGGYIRNAVVRAAFLAAEAGCPLGNQLLFHAAQLEYQAMGRILPSTL